MLGYISNWKQWYQGNVKGFHDYRIYNGDNYISQQRYSLNMGKQLCETWANLLFNEKCTIAVDDEFTNEFVHKTLDDNNFWVKINEYQELKAVYGLVCYIPFARDIYVTAEGKPTTAERIQFNYVTAENIYPLTWENGVITELATASICHTAGDFVYVWLQLMVLDENGLYVLKNRLLRVNGDQFIELDEIKGYEDLPKEIKTLSKVKPFVIDRLNISNNINHDSPFGVAVFANSIDVLKLLDVIFDSYKNEFILGRRRIMVTEEALTLHDGKPIFDPNDVVFYKLPAGLSADSDPYVNSIDIAIRAGDHQTALQNTLNLLSSKCGLGENYYKFEGTSLATATQVVSDNSTLYRTLKKHEALLESVLVDLIKYVIELGINFLKLPLNPDAEIKVTFDDSIIEDKNAEMVRDKADVDGGLMSKITYMMKWQGIPEEEARTQLKEIAIQNAELMLLEVQAGITSIDFYLTARYGDKLDTSRQEKPLKIVEDEEY